MSESLRLKMAARFPYLCLVKKSAKKPDQIDLADLLSGVIEVVTAMVAVEITLDEVAHVMVAEITVARLY